MTSIVVCVRYFNVLAHYAGKKRVELTLPAGTTISELMQVLVETNPDAFRRALGDSEIRASALCIFRNECLVTDEMFEEPIGDGDEFMLVPAISGG